MNLILISVFPFLISSTFGEIEVNKVADPVNLGDGPCWDAEKKVLYFVDILGESFNKYDPSTEKTTQVKVGEGHLGFCLPDRSESDKFIAGRGRDVISMTWDGESESPSDVKVLVTVEEDKPDNKLNDGKADSEGRLWAGTRTVEDPWLETNQGALYSFDSSDGFKPVSQHSPISFSNGLTWNKNDTLMFYTDSTSKTIGVFDFDKEKGTISNPRELFNLDKQIIGDKNAVTDGMTIDENDNLWVAVYGGSCVLHIDTSNGKLLNKIEFPVTRVTSCAFGGENLEDLYVTSAKALLPEEEMKNQPLAGALFKVTGLGVRGQMKPHTVKGP